MSSWVRLVASSTDKQDFTSKDNNRIFHLLEEELRSTAAQLKKEETLLSELLDSRKQYASQCNQLREKIREFEGYALEAMEKGEDDLAQEVVHKLVAFEEELERLKNAESQAKVEEGKLRASLRRLGRRSQQLKQQADTLYAAKSVQNAQLSLVKSQRQSRGGLRTAIDSYRAARGGWDKDATASSDRERNTSGDELLKKLEEAGIVRPEKRYEEIFQRVRKQYLTKQK